MHTPRPLLGLVILSISPAGAAEGDRFFTVGPEAGTLASLGPAAGNGDDGGFEVGVGTTFGWALPVGWLVADGRVTNHQFGAGVGWQINPDWGVAPAIGPYLGYRRARRSWVEDTAAGDTRRHLVLAGLDVGVRARGAGGWVVSVMARPSLALLSAQTTTRLGGQVSTVPGVEAPAPLSFAEMTVALRVGHSW